MAILFTNISLFLNFNLGVDRVFKVHTPKIFPVDEERFKLLADKYVHGLASEEETAVLLKIYQHYQNKKLNWDESIMGNKESTRQMLFSKIVNEIDSKPIAKQSTPIFRMIFIRYVAVASVILCLSIGGYYLFHKKPTQQIVQKQNITPGINKATLTLANGQKIILTKGLNGRLAQQGNALVQINSNNAITYTALVANITSTTPVQLNTLSTVRGEQFPYPLVLADGTKVWLNAESSITFPTSFNEKERVVKITGEVYFEVVHNVAHPFKVMVRDQTIEDLGTQFDINAYPDEPDMKTTLINGSVKVSKNAQHAFIKPGFQAIVSGSSIVVQAADLDQVMAWKNGNFEFEGTPLKVIMREISRWYDVDISYKEPIRDVEFGGSISRSKNINEILSVLETTGVHFKIEGRRILVMP